MVSADASMMESRWSATRSTVWKGAQVSWTERTARRPSPSTWERERRDRPLFRSTPAVPQLPPPLQVGTSGDDWAAVGDLTAVNLETRERKERKKKEKGGHNSTAQPCCLKEKKRSSRSNGIIITTTTTAEKKIVLFLSLFFPCWVGGSEWPLEGAAAEDPQSGRRTLSWVISTAAGEIWPRGSIHRWVPFGASSTGHDGASGNYWPFFPSRPLSIGHIFRLWLRREEGGAWERDAVRQVDIRY